MIEILVFLKNIQNKVEKNEFIGYNPYDLMASPYFRNFSDNKFLMYLTQLYKLFPLNLRPLLKIKRLYSPKAYGLLLSAFACQGKIDLSQTLISELILNKSKKFEEFSIGFPFPITLSWYATPINYPSLIITLFVIYGFIDIYKINKDEDLLTIVHGFINLIESELPKRETDDLLWYSYTFDNFNEVYNATAKIGKLYAKLYSIFPDEKYKNKIKKILRYLFENQRHDGTWPYDAVRNYTDGYHTAFVLEAIWEMQKIAYEEKYSVEFENGLSNYCNFLIKNENQPLYYHPFYKPKDIRKFFTQTDIRDCAMAIILLSKTCRYNLAENVLNWTFRNMYNKKKKYFYHYKERLWKNKIAFIRPQAWMYYAISVYKKYSDNE